MSGNATPITGRQVSWGIGVEEVQGYPVKAQALMENRSNSMAHQFARKFSGALTGRPSSRNKAARGAFTFNGQIGAEITPEGGFPRLLMARFPLTSAGAGPSYTHTFANLFGSKTVTLIRKDPQYLKVYPGCRVGNLTINTDKEDTDVMIVTADITALDELVFDLVANPAILATFGMDVASADPLPPYASEMAFLTYAGRFACVKSLNASFGRSLGLHRCLDKKHGSAGTYEMSGDTLADAVAYYVNKDWIYQDFGVVNPGNAFAPTGKVITAAIGLIFDPPVNPSAFVNRLTIEFPSADISGGEEVQGEEEIRQTITISPLDNAAGDGKITLVNSISGATLATTAVAVPFSTIPPSQSVWYWGGDVPAVGGGVVAPTIDVGTGDVNQFDLGASYHVEGTALGLPDGISTLPTTDGFFIGYTAHVIKGASKGQKATITGYTAATRRFTCGAGIDSLATGDAVALYK